MSGLTWKARLRAFWRGWVRPILLVVIVLSSLRSAVADWNDVPTGSMKPTILEGDRIFVNKLAYDLKVPFTQWRVLQWDAPHRGDIVVLFSPSDGTRLVKRVVGVPGDTIALHDNQLFVNGKSADYRPLDTDTIDQIEVSERTRHGYALENLGGAAHAVMTTPSIPAPRSFDRLVLPKGKFFVMGDNRDASADSRIFGMVDRSLFVGRVAGVAFSIDHNRYLPRWDRFFKGLR